MVFDARGQMLERARVGHAQKHQCGEISPGRPWPATQVSNFWKNPGIITLFDHDGNILAQDEPIHSGSP